MPFQVTHLYPYLTRKETTAQNIQNRSDAPPAGKPGQQNQ